MPNRTINIVRFLSRGLVLSLIKAYQKTISPDHGIIKAVISPFIGCRFQPTCSEYMYQAIEKYGVLKGGWKGFKRVMRCNPWSKGGHDPLV